MYWGCIFDWGMYAAGDREYIRIAEAYIGWCVGLRVADFDHLQRVRDRTRRFLES